MASPLYGSENFSTTLNVGGGINNSQTTGLVLTTVSNLNTSGGVLGLSWAATLDSATYEEIIYTGVTGNELTGVTRGSAGTSAKAHNNGATIVAVVSSIHNNRLADKLRSVDATAVEDTSGNEIIKTAFVASAVNEVTITNAITATAPQISATGGDTDINLKLSPKGSGVIVNDAPENYAADAGASDTYAVTITGISAYATGQVFKFKANTVNTGAATLNVNSLGAKTIVKNYNVTLADGDIKANQLVAVIYDGTNMQLLSPTANTSSTINFSTSGPQANFSTSSTTAVDVTGATVTINPASTATVNAVISGRIYEAQAGDNIHVKLLIDGVVIQETDFSFSTANYGSNLCLSGQASVASGARVIKMQIHNGTAARSVSADQVNVNVMYV